METLTIELNNPRTFSLLKELEKLALLRIVKTKTKAKAKAKPKSTLYERLDSAFADVRLMMDGKKREKTLDELIDEL